jgi:hypothetical protein
VMERVIVRLNASVKVIIMVKVIMMFYTGGRSVNENLRKF